MNVEAPPTARRPDVLMRAGRWLVGDLLGIPFPHRLEDPAGSLHRAQEHLKEGHGLVLVINHFSLRDFFDLGRDTVLKNPTMGARRVLIPIAYHQYDKRLVALGKALGIEFRAIVTQDTIDRGKNDGLPLNWGQDRYIADGSEVLKDGGIVLVAPQAKREDRLDTPAVPTIGFLAASNKKHHVENVAYVMIGLGVGEEASYRKDKTGGWNWLRMFDVRIGPFKTEQELLTEAGGDRKKLDDVVYGYLRLLVPKSYLKRHSVDGIQF